MLRSSRSLPHLSCAAIACVLSLTACDDGGGGADASVDAPVDAGPSEVRLVFDLEGRVDTQETFYDSPFPSDLRLGPNGGPSLAGHPNPRVALVEGLIPIGEDRPGFSTLPVGYFRFDGPIRALGLDERFAAEPGSELLLIDVDPDSPERGRLYPTIGVHFPSDRYTGENLLGVASFPGLVLRPNRTYAFVVRRGLGDSRGEPLAVNPSLAQLARGETPSGAWGADAAALYAPLFETLGELGVPADDVAAATVFTTGDVVHELRTLSDRVLDAFDVEIEGLAIDPSDGADHERYCELLATVSMPQFQRGTPPFDTEGLFAFDAEGLPIEQRRETALLTLTIPKAPMPEDGYPLMVYFHGSGGDAAQVVDRSPVTPSGPMPPGLGPAHVIAEHGFGSVGASLPLSPDRLPGASAIEYLNLNNLAAFRDTFRQGVLEQRLLIRALRELRIDAATIEACSGPSLPAGVESYRFDPGAFVALGQSMGGMYVNMIGGVEPGLSALVPTGAGGFWSYFILETSLIPGVRGLLGTALRTEGDDLSHLHPAMHLLELAWETAEPMVYMPRLSRRPLDGIAARPIYQPVGEGDSFFPTLLFDAVTLAYGHPQAGELVWPSMQESLAVGGLEGLIDYPVRDNLESEAGEPFTGVAVQYAGDGFSDPHNIFMQLPEVRYQWGCFLATAVETGHATVPAPAALGTPCPSGE